MMKKNGSIILIIVLALVLIILAIVFTNERIKKIEHKIGAPGKAQTELSIIKTR